MAACRSKFNFNTSFWPSDLYVMDTLARLGPSGYQYNDGSLPSPRMTKQQQASMTVERRRFLAALFLAVVSSPEIDDQTRSPELRDQPAGPNFPHEQLPTTLTTAAAFVDFCQVSAMR